MFTPELIDIITPYSKKAKELTAPDSSSSNSVHFKEGQKNDFQTLSNNSSDGSSNSLCLVIDYVDTDLDQILKHEIDFRSVYASLLQNKLNFDSTKIGIRNKALEGLF